MASLCVVVCVALLGVLCGCISSMADTETAFACVQIVGLKSRTRAHI